MANDETMSYANFPLHSLPHCFSFYLANKNLTRGLPYWGNLPLHLRHDFALLSYAIMSQECEKGRVALLQVMAHLDDGDDAREDWRWWRMALLQGSLRDEGATTERLRRLRVRRNIRDLGFRLAVVLNWLVQTGCASSGTVFLDLSEFQVILGMPWMIREEEERAPLFGFFAGDGAREAKPWLLCRIR
ncbi:hypothetical protein V8G54_013552 [Vigna mungo]|uniref:Uncharacterized protein n=1 Tax=Vigna mungo TaxID=3915 RepID=A0AAQ3NT48_VIGMU